MPKMNWQPLPSLVFHRLAWSLAQMLGYLLDRLTGRLLARSPGASGQCDGLYVGHGLRLGVSHAQVL